MEPIGPAPRITNGYKAEADTAAAAQSPIAAPAPLPVARATRSAPKILDKTCSTLIPFRLHQGSS